jgi:hypothetical protein
MDTSFGVPPSSVFPDSRLHSSPFVSATTVAAEERGSFPEHGASRLERLPLVGEIASPGKVSWAWPGVSPGPESRVTPLVLLLQSTLNWKVGLCLCDYVQCRVQELLRSLSGVSAACSDSGPFSITLGNSGDVNRPNFEFGYSIEGHRDRVLPCAGFVCLGSSLSILGLLRVGSMHSVSIVYGTQLGSSLSVASFGRECNSVSILGHTRLGDHLSGAEFVHLGDALAVYSTTTLSNLVCSEQCFCER